MHRGASGVSSHPRQDFADVVDKCVPKDGCDYCMQVKFVMIPLQE